MAPVPTSASSAPHTAGPATPSVFILFWSWKAMIAPLVMVFAVPSVQSAWSEAGSLPFHANTPSWAWAASWGAASGLAGVKLKGRYPKVASSCCRRRVPPLATANCTDWSAPRVFPDVLAMAPGMVTISVEVGTKGVVATKVNVVGVRSCHTPATAGVRIGWGEVGLRGGENCSEMDASLGMPVAALAGMEDTTVNGW